MSWWLHCPRPTAGGLALIRALGGKRIRPEGSAFRPKRKRKVINWGSTEDPGYPVINAPEQVSWCVNKAAFFSLRESGSQDMDEFVPEHCFTKERAVQFLHRGDWDKAVARTVLTGHSGAGIVITGKPENLPDAQLYVKYIKKDEEYRLHCIKDSQGNIHVFYAQKKVKRTDFEGKHNRLIRSHANGYIFQHNNINPPEVVLEAATRVFGAIGLDFGAVDVIYVREQNRAYVLEINTAPGLEGASVEAYAKAFQEYF